MTDDRQQVIENFDEAVNIAPKELGDWLQTEESQSVGQSDGGESKGHESGRRIVEIKRKKKSLTTPTTTSGTWGESSATSAATRPRNLAATWRTATSATR